MSFAQVLILYCCRLHGSTRRLTGSVLAMQKLLDRAGLVELLAGHLGVQVAVVLDRVAVCVEQGGVPVADGLVAFRPVVGQADVSAEHVEGAVVPGHEDLRGLGAVAVVGLGVLGEVDDDGVVEHRALALGDGLELVDDGLDLTDVADADSDIPFTYSANQNKLIATPGIYKVKTYLRD